MSLMSLMSVMSSVHRTSGTLGDITTAQIFHGKEGVDGSSPSEGSSRKAPHTRGFITSSDCERPAATAIQGRHAALASDPGFMKGLNVAAGQLTYEPVAHDQGLEYPAPEDALAKVPALA